MQLSKLALGALGVTSVSAKYWGYYANGNSEFWITGGDDVFPGLPAFLARCISFGALCFNIDGNSTVTYSYTLGAGSVTTIKQTANGVTAAVNVTGVNGGSTVWLVPTLI